MKTALVLLAARLLAPDGGVGRDAIDGTFIRCATLNQREVGGRRPLHAFICLDAGTGEARGAFLRRNGKVFCPITGAFDGTCLTLEACGEQQTEC